MREVFVSELVIVTSAPGTTARSLSRTVPVTAPLPVCPSAVIDNNSSAMKPASQKYPPGMVLGSLSRWCFIFTLIFKAPYPRTDDAPASTKSAGLTPAQFPTESLAESVRPDLDRSGLLVTLAAGILHKASGDDKFCAMQIIFAINARSTRLPEMESRRSLYTT